MNTSIGTIHARSQELLEPYLDRAPQLAYGILERGELIDHGGLAVDGRDVPDINTVFRIASMTKSFTAAAILRLRDQGDLDLDAPASRIIGPFYTAVSQDGPEVSIRHLLTMTAGFPTDNPWADRLQPMSPDSFTDLLATRPPLVWPPGTRVEYSNLGYAILGRIIETVTEQPFDAHITRVLLDPLGLRDTGFHLSDTESGRLVIGTVRRDDTWMAEPIDGHGAFSAMGGLFSTVADVSVWMTFLADAFPARDDADHPVLRRSTRRELQQAHAAVRPSRVAGNVLDDPRWRNGGYGYGLRVSYDPAHGPIVGHSGGYPGYGSHMTWHRATGLGVVVLANARYAPAWDAAADVLQALLRQRKTPTVTPDPRVLAARDGVERLLQAWNETEATGLFAANVAADEALTRRRARLEDLARKHGPFRPDDRRTRSTSPAHLAWGLRGRGATLHLSISLAPDGRVQELDVAVAEDLGASATSAVERLLSVLRSGHHDQLPATTHDDFDTDALLLAGQLARHRHGPIQETWLAARDGTDAAFAIQFEDGTHLHLTVALTGDETIRTASLRWPESPDTTI